MPSAEQKRYSTLSLLFFVEYVFLAALKVINKEQPQISFKTIYTGTRITTDNAYLTQKDLLPIPARSMDNSVYILYINYSSLEDSVFTYIILIDVLNDKKKRND